ncbi:MAG: patatin-like phospholipase family protein, partial [Bacteroidota bacterium]
MRALVISGGGSKGAFAGGVAQYLREVEGKDYDLYLGTSTGSLLISHLALDKTQKIKEVFTSVTQKSIFSSLPFMVKRLHGQDQISINHFNVVRNFIKGKKTFGESLNLKKLILDTLSREEFEKLK